MESISDVYETLSGIDVSVPASEMILLLVALTLCLLCRVTRMGLLLAFIGTYRWAWLAFSQTFKESHPIFLYIYFGLGVVIVILTILNWMFGEK